MKNKRAIVSIISFILLLVLITSVHIFNKPREDFSFIESKYAEDIDTGIIAYKRLPTWLQNKFKNENWKILITDDSFETKYDIEEGKVKGLTVPEEKIIYIKRDSIVYCLSHEMGHFIDSIGGFYSDSDEFMNFYNSESLMSKYIESQSAPYALVNEKEYFASSFATIIDSPQISADSQPQTYSYIANIINSLIEEDQNNETK